MVAAACSGDGETSPATTAAGPPPTTQPAPPPPATTAAPAPVTTPAPPAPTTTIAPEPEGLVPGLRAGTVATYSGSAEIRLAWSGAPLGEVYGLGDDPTGRFVTEVTGTQRFLAVEAGDGVEIVEDLIAEAGSVTTTVGETVESVEFTRTELFDVEPLTPPVVLDERWRPAAGVIPNAPSAFVGHFGALATAAAFGPPLTDGAVAVGDAWTYSSQDPFVGTVVVDVAVSQELFGPSGEEQLVLEFSGSARDLPTPLDVFDAFEVMRDVAGSDTPLIEFVSELSDTARVRELGVLGHATIDLASGLVVSLESEQALLVEFPFVDSDDVLEIEASAARSLTMTGHGPASPFDVSSILDRFAIDPSALAVEATFGLTGYEFVDSDEGQADVVFGRLDDVRSDLFAGVTMFRAIDVAGDEADVISLTLAGELRGAPFIGEEIARFLADGAPRPVVVGGFTVWRAEVDGREWMFYSNETHLFVTIGPRPLSERLIGELAATAQPYLWQPGDCADFTDGFDDATPYAPFGLHGLRHCLVEHSHQVIYSEVLPDAFDAPFPSDLSRRSDETCGRAFHQLTGTSELESALSLIRYLPDREEWEKGFRYLACVVSVRGPDGLVSVEGRIDGRDEAYRLELSQGTCLFDLFPVECDDPHNGEIIGVFVLPDPDGAERPDAAGLQALISDRCRAAFDDFDVVPGPATVGVFDVTDVFTAWEFGARRYYCVAAAFGNDGSRLAVTGTFGDGWEEAAERVAV